jgi:hypothetical protein
MQVTSTLKKRTPFAFASDEGNPFADASILDDQGKQPSADIYSASSRFSRPSNSTRSEQEEVIQSLKVENDISDRQIWLCLRIVMGCFAFLSVPIGLYSSDPFKLQVQIRSISLSKG